MSALPSSRYQGCVENCAWTLCDDWQGVGDNAGDDIIRRYASTFQMLRGTMVVFAGFLTIVLLKRRLHLHHWMGIILITAGAAMVGASRY